MSNIYSIPDWNSAGPYVKNSIVRTLSDGLYSYWYCLTDNPANGGNVPALNNPNWGGRAIAQDGLKQSSNFSSDGAYGKFIWVPSYNPTVRINARVKKIQFGDGYEQVTKDGLNNVLLEMDLTFDGRDSNEAAAVLHFLYARGGYETFLFTAPSPYATEKRWKSTVWSPNQVFYENYSIKATFTEVVI